MMFTETDAEGREWEVLIDVDIKTCWPEWPQVIYPDDEMFDYDENLRWSRLIASWPEGETHAEAIVF